MGTAMASVLATIITNRGDRRAINDELARATTRAEHVDKWLRAFTYRPTGYDVDLAVDQPLAGLPIGVKDLFNTKDMPTTYGSRVHVNNRPEDDASIVADIRQLGGIILGKTATAEFGWKDPAPTVNPSSSLHTPGGSSSGSAAAVGAGIVPLAVGTQTVGSIIRPAAFCGVVGYKPTFGKVSTSGSHPLAPSLDHVGFFSRSVEDVAVASALFVLRKVDAIASSPAWKDWFGHLRSSSIKLGVVRTPFWNLALPHQRANFHVVIGLLRAAGVDVRYLEYEHEIREMHDAVQTIVAREAYKSLGAFVRDYSGQVSERIRSLVEEGGAIAETRYAEALAIQTKARAIQKDAMDGCDALLTLPALGEAPYGLNDTGDPRCCGPWSLIGVPAVNVPSGWSAAGLPLGIQVVGRFDDDLHLLRVASTIESIIGLHS